MVKYKVLISEERLKENVKELAEQISRDYEGKELVLVGVLKGGFIFLADLAREISIPVKIDFISVSSYGNATESSGVVKIIKDVDADVTGKHVLIVEDMIDTGVTLNYLKDFFSTKGCKSVKICTALNKPARRKTDVVIEYKGMEIPDEFVVGYGLDYAGKYRNLKEVVVVEEI